MTIHTAPVTVLTLATPGRTRSARHVERIAAQRMGRFGWPVKTTKHTTPPQERDTHPQPLYREQDHASCVASPSTTVPMPDTTTNTTQTAHFLSLPIWRKRQEPQVNRSQCLSMSMLDIRTYQADFDHQREQTTSSSRIASSSREKSLPPTPTSSNEDVSGTRMRRSHSPIDSQTSSRSSRRAPQSTTASPARSSPANAKAALAQATLAIGLPHGIPQASASSSRSDVNSMAFMTIPQARLHPDARPNVRRAKSLHQLSRKFGRDHDDNALAGNQRSRRSNASGPDGKDEGKALEDIPPHVTPPRNTLVRGASFWNRKRNDSLKPAIPPPPSEHPRKSLDHLSHILPALPPMSPFHFDTNIPRSSHSSQTEEQLPASPPGLNPRSDSRNRPLPSSPAASSPDLSVQTLQPSSLRRKRPSTADPPTDRSRTLPPYSHAHDDHSSPRVPAPPQHPDVPTLQPTARPRSHTNPPFLHRLSANILSFGTSSLLLPTNGANGTPSNRSPGGSPRPSISKFPPPKPMNEESPTAYVNRLLDTINKADVASALASSGESFYTNALQAYIDRFEFDRDPLDVALRKLLMDVGLPRETQQIDRVMEAFANRYMGCNRNLFISDDHPYILAFSLIMLHTDAFNKSNKRKMTKADYIKNTQLSGIFPEVLEYFYDNIVFAPFIFIEDPVETNLQRNHDSGPTRTLSGFPSQHYLSGNSSTATLLGKTNKIDPYYLIAKNLLGPLRLNVDEYIPLENHYSFKDDSGVWDEENVHETFINAGTIEVDVADRRMSSSRSSSTYSHQDPVLRVAKVGLLNRKDTTLDIGKRAKAGKWRLWSVILTSSQLLFFRDHTWATSLQEQMKSMGYRDERILVPPVSLLKPDEMLSLKDSVALFDPSYDKHDTFLLIASDRRPFLFQAPGEEDMNSWVSCINYASAFKTTGVSMRAPGMSGTDVELMGVAAAASHLRDLQCANTDPQKCHVRPWGRSSDDFIDRLSSSPSAPYAVSRSGRAKVVIGREIMDLDVSATPNSNSHRLKATFHQVKADLAAGRWSSIDAPATRPNGRPRAHSLETVAQPLPASFPEGSEDERLSTRTRDIQTKLAALDSKISSLQRQEESDLRLLRNIAVLTPFKKATREKLGMVVLQASKGLQKTRLELGMWLCHQEVLSNDLVGQEREWRRTKKIALKAATDTLQSRREPSIPRTLPLRVDQPVAGTSDGLPETSHAPESSVAESFRTALDFDWPVSAVGEQLDSPIVSVRDGTPTGSPSPLSSAQAIDSTRGPSQESLSTAPTEEPDEEAEEWNKTRAAKRVSLVRMPSTLNVRLGSVSGPGSIWVTRSPRSAAAPEP
ncbi:hypothetical protein BC827DRAFT_293936 [Russula dissimulans]|nr:hypothetical protein BC827DRAFT_293936 [Russula dissimulans]